MDFTRLQEPRRSLTAQPLTSLYVSTTMEHDNLIDPSNDPLGHKIEGNGTLCAESNLRSAAGNGGLAEVWLLWETIRRGCLKDGRCKIPRLWLGIFRFS